MQKIKLQFPLRFLIIAAFVALVLSMVITTSAESISATIIEDGQSRTVKVSSTETEDILEEAGITIQSEKGRQVISGKEVLQDQKLLPEYAGGPLHIVRRRRDGTISAVYSSASCTRCRSLPGQ